MSQQHLNKNFRSGVVSIVGRPNVGKSTLLNRVLNEKVSIVSPIPQTTRNQIRGIYNDERGQIVFIDTPGLHIGKDRLDLYMNESSTSTFNEVDCIIYLVDTTRKIGEEEENIARKLASVRCPIIFGLNKVDIKSGKSIPDYISFWQDIKGLPVEQMESFTLLPLSGQEGVNINKLLDIVFEYLPEGEALYPADTISDVPQRIMVADLIREKLFLIMRQEIPHSIGVVIETIEPKRNKAVIIQALIYVERDSQKEIVIGKGGSVLKQIGTSARHELQELFDAKIFLDLQVKVRKKWRDDISILEELGYQHD